MRLIPNAIPNFSREEKEALSKAIENTAISLGPDVCKFENAVAQYVGAKYAVSTNSGTSALHLCLIECGVRSGDLVLTSTFSFAATANCIFYVGAEPIFMDIDPETMCLDAARVQIYLENNCEYDGNSVTHKLTGRRVAAIMPVHVYGHSVDMGAIEMLAEKYGLPVVEDAAESLGAKYKDNKIGKLSKYCGLSFNGNKIITTGAGGMILTSSEHVAKTVRHYANQCKIDAITHLHDDVGYNYRMPNLNAAIGVEQVRKLPGFVSKKRKIAERYNELFCNLDGLRIAWESEYFTSSFWMPILRWDGSSIDISPSELVHFLLDNGIQARLTWSPLHSQKAYRFCPHDKIVCANLLHESSICLPCSTSIDDDDLVEVVNTVKTFIVRSRGK